MSPLVGDAGRFFEQFVYHLRPAGAEEDALRGEIDALPSEIVSTGDAAALAERGYRTGECHRNCIAAERDGLGQQVFGWTETPHIYLSHSVMRDAAGQLHCITPEHTDELDSSGRFLFRPDPSFSFDGTYMRRNGVYPPRALTVIRRDAALVKAHYDGLLQEVQAGRLTFDEAVARAL